MEYICGMDILETPQNLIEEIANVVVGKFLSFQKFVQVGFHQALHDVSVSGERKS